MKWMLVLCRAGGDGEIQGNFQGWEIIGPGVTANFHS